MNYSPEQRARLEALRQKFIRSDSDQNQDDESQLGLVQPNLLPIDSLTPVRPVTVAPPKEGRGSLEETVPDSTAVKKDPARLPEVKLEYTNAQKLRLNELRKKFAPPADTIAESTYAPSLDRIPEPSLEKEEPSYVQQLGAYGQRFGEEFERGLEYADIDQAIFTASIDQTKTPEYREQIIRQWLKKKRELAAEAPDRIDASIWKMLTDPSTETLGQVGLDVAGIAGPMLKSQVQGGLAGIATAAHQKYVPHPFAKGLGYAKGHAAGTFQYWTRQGYGSAMGAMIEANVPFEVASSAAATVAPFYAYIERLQMGRMLKHLPLSDQARKVLMAHANGITTKVAKKVTTNAVVRKAVEVSQDIPIQISQELLQETSILAAKDAAALASHLMNQGEGVEYSSAEDYAEALKGVWEMSGSIAAVSGLFGGGGAYVSRRQETKAFKKQVELLSDDALVGLGVDPEATTRVKIGQLRKAYNDGSAAKLLSDPEPGDLGDAKIVLPEEVSQLRHDLQFIVNPKNNRKYSEEEIEGIVKTASLSSDILEKTLEEVRKRKSSVTIKTIDDARISFIRAEGEVPFEAALVTSDGTLTGHRVSVERADLAQQQAEIEAGRKVRPWRAVITDKNNSPVRYFGGNSFDEIVKSLQYEGVEGEGSLVVNKANIELRRGQEEDTVSQVSEEEKAPDVRRVHRWAETDTGEIRAETVEETGIDFGREVSQAKFLRDSLREAKELDKEQLTRGQSELIMKDLRERVTRGEISSELFNRALKRKMGPTEVDFVGLQKEMDEGIERRRLEEERKQEWNRQHGISEPAPEREIKDWRDQHKKNTGMELREPLEPLDQQQITEPEDAGAGGQPRTYDESEPSPDIVQVGQNLDRPETTKRSVADTEAVGRRRASGAVSLIGSTVNDSETLGRAFEALRNKDSEWTYLIWRDEKTGEVLSVDAHSFFMPGGSPGAQEVARARQGDARFIENARQRTVRLQARANVGNITIDVVHNHPGGKAQPSEEDVTQTKEFVQLLDRIEGASFGVHTIVNTGEATTINRDLNWRMYDIYTDEDLYTSEQFLGYKTDKERLNHEDRLKKRREKQRLQDPMYGVYQTTPEMENLFSAFADSPKGRPMAIATSESVRGVTNEEVGQFLKNDEGKLALAVILDAASNVRAAIPFNVNMLKDQAQFKNWARNRRVENGGRNLVVYYGAHDENPQIDVKSFTDLVTPSMDVGDIYDAIYIPKREKQIRAEREQERIAEAIELGIDPERVKLPKQADDAPKRRRGMPPPLPGAPDFSVVAEEAQPVKAKALQQAVLNAEGTEFETGKPVSFTYLRNTVPAPDMGARFGQDIEPAGRYISHRTTTADLPPEHRLATGEVVTAWEAGDVAFENPLVIEHGDTRDWKARLSAAYDGKTGKELSEAIRRDGHDGVVTVNTEKGFTSEIVDLQVPDFTDDMDAPAPRTEFDQDELIAQAEKQYGLTDDLNEAGYITIHGDLLDFSGKAQGGPAGTRNMDHREINMLGQDFETGEGPEMLRNIYDNAGSSIGYMQDFINRSGSVRISSMPAWGPTNERDITFHYSQPLTARQRQRVRMAARGAAYVAIDHTDEQGRPLRSFAKESPQAHEIEEFLTSEETGDAQDPTIVREEVEALRRDKEYIPMGDPQREANFQKWFEGSKVVDGFGHPLRMYHGSPDAFFDAFETSDWIRGQSGYYSSGSYFTNDPDVANTYTRERWRGIDAPAPAVYPVYLSIKNPLDMNARADINVWKKAFGAVGPVTPEEIKGWSILQSKRLPEIWEEAEEELEATLAQGGVLTRRSGRAPSKRIKATNADVYFAVMQARKKISEVYPVGEPHEFEETFRSVLESMGHDGITHEGRGLGGGSVDRHKVYIAWNPAQIKSATGNRGTFDPEDPSILREEVEALSKTNEYIPMDDPQREANFKKWFGDSRVVNPSTVTEEGVIVKGQPLRVYHGTREPSPILKFKGGESGVRSTSHSQNLGMHFGTIDQANDILDHYPTATAGEFMEGKEHFTFHALFREAARPQVYPVFLSIENPLELFDTGEMDEHSIIAQLRDHGEFEALEAQEAIDRLAEHTLYAAGAPRGQALRDIKEFLQDRGYDGIRYINRGEGVRRPVGSEDNPLYQGVFADPGDVLSPQEINRVVVNIDQDPDEPLVDNIMWDPTAQDGDNRALDDGEFLTYFDADESWVAFDPRQIKSATGNRGTFDPENPSILREDVDPLDDINQRALPLHFPLDASAIDPSRPLPESITQNNPMREENFRRWFKNSKIVDADDEPLVVFHGSAQYFDAFGEYARDPEYPDAPIKAQRGPRKVRLILGDQMKAIQMDEGESAGEPIGEQLNREVRLELDTKAKREQHFPDEVFPRRQRVIGMGHHFGNIEQADYMAMDRARRAGESSSMVYSAYLSIQNPLRLPDMLTWDPVNVAAYIHAGNTEIDASSEKWRNLIDQFTKRTTARRWDHSVVKTGLDDPVTLPKYGPEWAPTAIPEVAVEPNLSSLDKAFPRDPDRQRVGFLSKDELNAIDLQQVLKEMGYDGIVYLNRGEGVTLKGTDTGMTGAMLEADPVMEEIIRQGSDEEFSEILDGTDSYIAFDPPQIKSATGNLGTYSDVDPRMVHEDVEELESLGIMKPNPNYGQDPGVAQRAGLTQVPKYLGHVDQLRIEIPDPLVDDETFDRWLGRLIGEKEPLQMRSPAQAMEWSKSPEKLQEYIKSQLRPEMRKAARDGLGYAAQRGKMYHAGRMSIYDTAHHVMWNMLSTTVSPYGQESAYLDTLKPKTVMEFYKIIQKAIDSNGQDIDEEAWRKWIEEAIPKGSPGRQTISNLNRYYESFLPKATVKVEKGPYAGKSPLELLHEWLSDSSLSGREIRRRYWEVFRPGTGMDNKLVSFMLLTSGHNDVLVLDRVQTRNMWGGATGLVEYPDRFDPYLDGMSRPGHLSSVRGVAVYEALEDALAPAVAQAYKQMGRGRQGTLARLHWESYSIAGQMWVSHKTLDASIKVAEGKRGQRAIVGTGPLQGKMDTYESGFKYEPDAQGRPQFHYAAMDGKTYILDRPALESLIAEVKSHATRKTISADERIVPYGFSVKERQERKSGRQLSWIEGLGPKSRQRFEDAIRKRASRTIQASKGVQPNLAAVTQPDLFREDVDDLESGDVTGKFRSLHDQIFNQPEPKPPPVTPPEPPPGGEERRLITSLERAERVVPEDERRWYVPQSNLETRRRVEQIYNKGLRDGGESGGEAALRRLVGDEADEGTAERTAAGIMLHSLLMDKAARGTGEESENLLEQAVDVAALVSARLTRAGQEVQAANMISMLTPESVGLYVQRRISKINEQFGLTEEEGKKAKRVLTSVTGTRLKALAAKAQVLGDIGADVQQMNNVVDDLLEQKTLTPDQVEQLQAFRDKVKQHLEGDPDTITEEGVRTKGPEIGWVKVLRTKVRDKAADARERLRVVGRLRAGIPIDEMADLALVGADKIAELGENFTTWQESMRSELAMDVTSGDMSKIYKRSLQVYRDSRKEARREFAQLKRIDEVLDKVATDPSLRDVEDIATVVSAISELSTATEEARIAIGQEVETMLRQLTPRTKTQMVTTFLHIGRLLAPKTGMRNIIGNQLAWYAERLSTMMAASIDKTVTGAQRLAGADAQRRIIYTPAQSQIFDAIEFIRSAPIYGLKEAWHRAAPELTEGMKAGYRGIAPRGLPTAADLPQGKTFDPMSEEYRRAGMMGKGIYKGLEVLEGLMGANLRGFDFAAYMRGYHTVMREQAELAIDNENVTFESAAEREAWIDNWVSRADQNVSGIADDYARYITFQDDTVLSKMSTSLKHLLNMDREFFRRIAGERLAKRFPVSSLLGEMILPYPRVPANLLNRGLAYSPAGFLKAGKLLIRGTDLIEGGNYREGIMALSRASLGSGAFALTIHLTKLGLATGGSEDEWKIRDLQRQTTGEGPYRMNVTGIKRYILSGFEEEAAKKQKGDIFVSYDWAQPLAISVAMAANVQTAKQAAMHKEGARGLTGAASDVTRGGIGAMRGAAHVIQEAPMLSGISDLFKQYGANDTVADSFVRVLEKAPSSFVPQVINQLRTYNDNTQREWMAPGNPLMTAVNKTINRLPFVSKMLPKAYKTLGVNMPKQVYSEGRNTFFNVFFNPAFVSEYNPDPIAVMLLEPYEKAGEKGQIPRGAPKSLIIEGIKMNLDTKDRAEMQRVGAVHVTRNFERFRETNKYINRNGKQKYVSPRGDNYEEEQLEALTGIVSAAGSAARNWFVLNRMQNYIKDGDVKGKEGYDKAVKKAKKKVRGFAKMAKQN